MGFKCQWRRTTKRVFEMADQLVHELAKRELAALSACAPKNLVRAGKSGGLRSGVIKTQILSVTAWVFFSRAVDAQPLRRTNGSGPRMID